MTKPIQHGSTDVSVVVRVLTASTGVPATGIAHNNAGAAFWYRRTGGTKTTITLSDLASLSAAHSDGGWEEIGDGEYRLDVADAAFASAADEVVIGGTFTDNIVISEKIALVAYNPQDAVSLGLSRLD